MTLRRRDRIVVGVIVVLAVMAGYDKKVLSPERSKAAALITAIASERATLGAEQQTYATGRAAQTALRANAPQWAALRLAVPAQSDIPGLLRVLERAADSVHVAMKAIQLTAPGTAAASSSTTTAAAGATAIPIQLTFNGGYTALDRLVKRIDRFVVVSGTKVHATGPLLSIDTVSLTGAPDLTVQLTASIYQLPSLATAGTTTGGQP